MISLRHLGFAATALLALIPAMPAAAQTTTFSLPLTTGSGSKLNIGTFGAGQTFSITVTGFGDLVDSRFQVNPDGTLHAPTTGDFSFANFGAAYSTTYGGDGINHFIGGGANFDAAGTGFGFAGPLTTDTTNPADIRLGTVVGTFSAAPTRSDWFVVGSGGTFKATTAGNLYLAVLDTYSPNDHGTYNGTLTTPAAVPEASTTVSLGLLLVLGMGGAVVARKKRAAIRA